MEERAARAPMQAVRGRGAEREKERERVREIEQRVLGYNARGEDEDTNSRIR